ncbi:MAG: hypothetical protein EOP93_20260 [Lysobacteraceae bacterium]|nr:MAG: hypothetical protein EOP93_20260 [Xanthomonadaceae bacterium]
MRRWMIALGMALLASAASAEDPGARWRLGVNGNAEAAGRIIVQLAAADGAPLRASVEVCAGRGEGAIARDVGLALRMLAGNRFKVAVDGTEDVLVSRRDGGRDFAVSVVENNVPGVDLQIGVE